MSRPADLDRHRDPDLRALRPDAKLPDAPRAPDSLTRGDRLDNGASDDAAERVRREWPGVRLIRSERPPRLRRRLQPRRRCGRRRGGGAAQQRRLLPARLARAPGGAAGGRARHRLGRVPARAARRAPDRQRRTLRRSDARRLSAPGRPAGRAGGRCAAAARGTGWDRGRVPARGLAARSTVSTKRSSPTRRTSTWRCACAPQAGGASAVPDAVGMHLGSATHGASHGMAATPCGLCARLPAAPLRRAAEPTGAARAEHRGGRRGRRRGPVTRPRGAVGPAGRLALGARAVAPQGNGRRRSIRSISMRDSFAMRRGVYAHALKLDAARRRDDSRSAVPAR